mmetsp:Transcript_518/g.2064  ORF Transcript_518/g.2064 Transcript_518/m.2064 type:complete len:209 (+) Transcript_518:4067-4693(+)
MFHPLRSISGLGYMVVSPVALGFPQRYICPPLMVAKLVMLPQAILLSMGKAMRWVNTSICLGLNSSFCSLCPSLPYPPLPHEYMCPSAVKASEWLFPDAIFRTFLSASAAIILGAGWGWKYIFSDDSLELYWLSVPWPSWPNSGLPADRTPEPVSHSVNSTPQVTELQSTTWFLMGSEWISSWSFFFDKMLNLQDPKPSWPILLVPKL